MATKKTAAPAETIEPEVDEPTVAELEHDARLSMDELLVDMPALRAPHNLRLFHKNVLRNIVYKYQDVIAEYRKSAAAGERTSDEVSLYMMDLAAEVDTDFAEPISDDRAAYAEWAEKNSKPEVFLAILTRYMEALGE